MHRMKKAGGWVGVRSLSHSSSASGGKGGAGVCQIGPSRVTSQLFGLGQVTSLPRSFSSGISCERQHVGWPGSQSHAEMTSARPLPPSLSHGA